jgi:hypothetical protein
VPLLASPHVPADAQPTYNSNPPTSGPHTAQTAAWGLSTAELPDVALAHNLEHGGIILHYQPALDAAQVWQLTQLADDLRRHDRKVILAPRTANDAPITATAWGRILKLQTVDEQALRDFFAAYINRGPERES